jgi:hypothetical protein
MAHLLTDMVNIQTVVLIGAIIVALNMHFGERRAHKKVHVVSTVDSRKYLVLNLPDKLVAANQLARLQLKMERFIAHITRHELERAPPYTDIGRLQSQFRALLTEHLPDQVPGSLTSFTVNKGAEIHMCIRDGDEITDENTLFFVALHELAHVMSISVGHKEEFWSNFRQLLAHAIRYGFYHYKPYHHSPVRYCGSYIRDTPLKA